MGNYTQTQADHVVVQQVASAYAAIKITELGIQHVIVVLLVIFLTNYAKAMWKKRNFLRFSEASKCSPVTHAPNPFPMPWSLNRKYEIYKASLRGDLFDNHFRRQHAKYGNTHAIISPLFGRQKGINTIEPENFKAVLATKFDDYKRSKYRLMSAQPMLLPGILTLDGHVWSHWRSVIRTQFTRKNFDANVAASERHMQLAFMAFGTSNAEGWSEDFNLMDHVYRLSMDTVTMFLFGHSAETQTAKLIRLGLLPPSASTVSSDLDNFAETFMIASYYVGHRIKLSNMYWLLDSIEFRRSCRELRRMVDAYVTSVRTRCKEARGGADVAGGEWKPTNVIEEMEARGTAQRDMVDQATHLLVAGMDTSSASLGWIFAMLAAHPEKYGKLRAEVVAKFGTEEHRLEEFNLETLKSCMYLQYCFQEVLRLFPAGPINVRVAVRDTVLPVGGGPDGKDPVAVKKGARVQMGTYLAHRRKDIWGEDADEFRPERWAERRRGWEFVPFSGGPQICLGQGYSMTQVSFFIARIVMRYDKIEPVEGSNNFKRGWMSVLTPAEGVHVRLHLAPESKPLEI